MFYLYSIPGVTFSSNFLHAVTFLHVLHLDVLKRQIEIETESKNCVVLCDRDCHGLSSIIAIHKEISVFTFSFSLNLSSKDIKVENR